MKNGTFSVPGPCIFSAFAISVFSVCPGSTAIFGLKSVTQPFSKKLIEGVTIRASMPSAGKK